MWYGFSIWKIWVPPQCWSILGWSNLMISNTQQGNYRSYFSPWWYYILPNETSPAINFEKSHYSFFCVEFSGWCHAKMAPENGKMQRCQIWHLIIETRPYPDGVAIEWLWSVDGVYYFHRPEYTLQCHSDLMEWYWSGIGVCHKYAN